MGILLFSRMLLLRVCFFLTLNFSLNQAVSLFRYPLHKGYRRESARLKRIYSLADEKNVLLFWRVKVYLGFSVKRNVKSL